MKGKFSVMAYYGFALVGGLVTGGLFSKAMYHKGKADAYNHCSQIIEDSIGKVDGMIQERLEEEEEA